LSFIILCQRERSYCRNGEGTRKILKLFILVECDRVRIGDESTLHDGDYPDF
jgi:hypothetical protein